MNEPALPYGLHDLDPEVECVDLQQRRVRCFVRNCRQVLHAPRRGQPGEYCPDHGIRCHYSTAGGTYVYKDVRRNIIASPEVFARRIVRHPFKYESHRLGAERSEDALSWNVFRSLQEAGCLGALAQLITGETSPIEPFLYLWGICVTDDDFSPWDLLVAARRRFESNLPVVRPLTEPDIALHLPGRYLILIEAKFTSLNTYYESGKRANPSSLTAEELIGLYQDPHLQFLNVAAGQAAPKVYHQLWRNTTFAEWMAKEDHPNTRAYHVNLVRQGYDEDSAAEFRLLVDSQLQERFQQITWESIYRRFEDEPALGTLRKYLKCKTAGLRPAFRLPRAL